MNRKTKQVLFSSAKPDYSTPPELFSLLNDEFHFGCDLAAQDDETDDAYAARRTLFESELRTKLAAEGVTLSDPAIAAEFHAAVARFPRRAFNALLPRYFTAERSALSPDAAWSDSNYMNPPYGRGIGHWMQAAKERAAQRVSVLPATAETPEMQISSNGVTTVCLVPARTDTKWFWLHCVSGASEIRLLRGRLKFSGMSTGAPFPSAVIVYRPWSGTPPKAQIIPWDSRLLQSSLDLAEE